MQHNMKTKVNFCLIFVLSRALRSKTMNLSRFIFSNLVINFLPFFFVSLTSFLFACFFVVVVIVNRQGDWRVYFEKIAGFSIRHLCPTTVLVRQTLTCARVFVKKRKKKKTLFPFRHKFPSASSVPGSSFAIIFTVEINRACCVVWTVQNDHRRCSHFRILRNWDEETRIWTLFFYVIFFINKKNFFTSTRRNVHLHRSLKSEWLGWWFSFRWALLCVCDGEVGNFRCAIESMLSCLLRLSWRLLEVEWGEGKYSKSWKIIENIWNLKSFLTSFPANISWKLIYWSFFLNSVI